MFFVEISVSGESVQWWVVPGIWWGDFIVGLKKSDGVKKKKKNKSDLMERIKRKKKRMIGSKKKEKRVTLWRS